MAKSQGEVIPVDRAKALVFYQAALAVWPQNYMAANDLGVALCKAANMTPPATNWNRVW